MTKFDAAWVKAEGAKRALPDANGIDKARGNHSSWGVGLRAFRLGTASKSKVSRGLRTGGGPG